MKINILKFLKLKKKEKERPVIAVTLPSIIRASKNAKSQEDPDEMQKKRAVYEAQLIAKVVGRFVDAFDKALLRHTKVIQETILDHTDKLNQKIEEEIKKVNDNVKILEKNLKKDFEEREKERDRKIYEVLKQKGFVLPSDSDEVSSVYNEEQLEEPEDEFTGHYIEEDITLVNSSDIEVDDKAAEEFESKGADVVADDSSEIIPMVEKDKEKDEKEGVELENKEIGKKNDLSKKEVKEREILPLETDSRYWITYNIFPLYFLNNYLKEKSKTDVSNEKDYFDIDEFDVFLKSAKFNFEKLFKIKNLDEEYLKLHYFLSIETYSNLFFFVKDYLKENQKNVSNTEFLEVLYLLDLLKFLLEKSVFSGASMGYYSADFSFKIGLHHDIENRYKFYSRTFLSSHNASVLFLVLTYLFSFKRNNLTVKQLILAITSALVHDIGKIYSKRVSGHKEETVWQMIVNDYISNFKEENFYKLLESFGIISPNLNIHQRKGKRRTYSNSNDDEEYKMSSSSYLKEFDVIKFTNSEDFMYLKTVFKYHSTLNVEESLSKENLDLFKVIFYADKYARLFENRLIEYYKKRYDKDNLFDLGPESLYKTLSMDNFFKLVPDDFKKAFYSNSGLSSINNSSYSSITKELSDKGKKVFLEDFKEIIKFFVYVEGIKNIQEYDFYNIGYLEARKIYRVPMKSLAIELISRGWANLSTSYFNAVSTSDKEPTYKGILHDKDLAFIYKKLGFNIFDISKNFFIEEAKDTYYLCLSKDFVDKIK